ncbi:TPA: ribonuclease P protein subunit [Candidatus Bathyarchaeota archaeon]|nr:ribonuclease P protein subunit [Candidatus Bathyarchaeota archaeon]
MKVTPAILKQEFIGLAAKVVRSRNSFYEGINGKVIDETKNTLTILHRGKKKVIVKEISLFHFTLPDGTVIEVDGKSIVGRPEDRLKKRIRRLW